MESAKILLKRGLRKVSDTEDKWEFTRDLKHRIAALYGYPQEVVRRLASEVSLILMAVYKKNYTQFWRYRVYYSRISNNRVFTIIYFVIFSNIFIK